MVTRKISVIHRANKLAWVTEGLNDGEQICVTPIEIISEGMQINVVNAATDSNQTQP